MLEDQDGVLQLAKSKLESAIRSYEEALTQVDNARVQLAETKAGYKYRYTVVTPAELPKRPTKSTSDIIGAAAVVGGGLFALLLAAAVDLVGGRILESWQVRRRLKLEVFGELDLPS